MTSFYTLIICASFLLVVGWLVYAIATGSGNEFAAIDRATLGYQSKDFSPELNQAVTRLEQGLIGSNQSYHRYWRSERIAAAIGAIAGVIAAGIAFLSRNREGTSRSSPITAIAVFCGLVSACIPPIMGYLSKEASQHLLAADDIKKAIDSGVARVRADGSFEPDVILELNAVAAKHGMSLT